MRFIVTAAAVAVFGLGACTSSFEAAGLDATTGRFVVNNPLPAEAVKVREAYPVDQARGILLVRTNLSTVSRYEEYFESSIESFGFFNEVMRADEFERMLVRAGVAGEGGSADGFTGLAQAAESIGPFLVADFTLAAGAGYQVDMEMTVYDPATATEIFKVDHGVTNWAGLDGVLFEPALNEFVAWLEENSPTYPENGRTPQSAGE